MVAGMHITESFIGVMPPCVPEGVLAGKIDGDASSIFLGCQFF